MRNTRPRISVILPVFNSVDTVGRAIQSILGQTEQAFEFIVIDDGSDDGSLEVIRSEAGRDRRVKVLRHRGNLGVVAAANLGHRHARSDLVARMDADDSSHPERLAMQAAFLDANPDCAACGSKIRVTALPGKRVGDGFRRFESWVNGLITNGSMAAERFVETPLVQPSVMIRQSAYRAIGGYRDCRWAEDYDLWLRLWEQGYQLGKVDEVLLDWADRPGRLTRTDPRYGHPLFLEAKAHFIGKIARAHDYGVAICGAGSNGKQLARHFADAGVSVQRFYDVHPRRIGVRIRGVEVFERSALPEEGREVPLLIGAVGIPGGRAEVREFVCRRGYIEGDSFYCAV